MMPTGHYQRSPRVEKVILVCRVCNGERKYTPSMFRQVTGNFCSKKCEGLARRKPGSHILVFCNQCGQLFKKRTDTLKSRNYCSVGCSGQSQKVDGARWRDPDQIKQYMQEYRSLHRLKLNEQAVRNQKKPEQKLRKLELQRSRRAAKGDFTSSQWIEILEIYDFCCAQCGCSDRIEADHIIPLAMDGDHTKDNIQPLCRVCNAKKHTTAVDYRQMYLIRKGSILKRKCVNAFYGIDITLT